MNILLLSNNDLFIKTFQKNIKKLDKETKFFKSDFSTTNILKIKKYFNKISICIIASENQEISVQEKTDLSFFCGYSISSNIPVFTNLNFLNFNPNYPKNNIKFFDNTNTLSEFIQKNFKKLKKISIKNSAQRKLFNLGVPFTSDCFANTIIKNNAEIFNLFIEAGIDVNSCDDNGTPVLNIAVRNDNEDLTNELINLGADINAVSHDRGYTALMDAVWKGNKDIAEILIKKGADLNTISKEGQSNLILAVGANKIDICQLLAENGADPDIKDQMGMSAYSYASLFHKDNIIEILKPYHKE